MRRVAVTLLLVLGVVGSLATSSAGAAQLGWHSEAPIGALGVPAPVGEVGDIEFWEPNLGALITGGTKGSPGGVYVYDGTGWHLYSTVCGGSEGKIAWTGPNEFWTVSDYATRQEDSRGPEEEAARTLCHFEDGAVVASYAQPLGAVTGFRKMEAAACHGPADCWFAGEPLSGVSPNTGPFHLHWDGAAFTSVPSLVEPQPEIEDAAGSITGLAFLSASLFESATEAPFVRSIDPFAPRVFSPVALPEGVEGPLDLAGDGGQLWAVAESGDSALRDIGSGFEDVPLGGAKLGTVKAAGSEPDAAAVWVGGEVSVAHETAATLTRVSASGSVSATITLPGPEEELDVQGGVTHVVCPAIEQCWMATRFGWLFHLGGPVAPNTDPAMHALITFRPEDESTRKFVPAGTPEDTSGEMEAKRGGIEEPLGEPFPERRKAPRLLVNVKQRIVDKTVLELSFTLRARAHVQLLARVRGKVVAKTAKMTLAEGRHHLRLRLDPKHWPTGLDFRVHPIGRRPSK